MQGRPSLAGPVWVGAEVDEEHPELPVGVVSFGRLSYPDYRSFADRLDRVEGVAAAAVGRSQARNMAAVRVLIARAPRWPGTALPHWAARLDSTR